MLWAACSQKLIRVGSALNITPQKLDDAAMPSPHREKKGRQEFLYLNWAARQSISH